MQRRGKTRVKTSRGNTKVRGGGVPGTGAKLS